MEDGGGLWTLGDFGNQLTFCGSGWDLDRGPGKNALEVDDLERFQLCFHRACGGVARGTRLLIW